MVVSDLLSELFCMPSMIKETAPSNPTLITIIAIINSISDIPASEEFFSGGDNLDILCSIFMLLGLLVFGSVRI
ncbi:MAG: hypothetical protein NVS1B11_11950 [Terriglobales bacterium]